MNQCVCVRVITKGKSSIKYTDIKSDTVFVVMIFEKGQSLTPLLNEDGIGNRPDADRISMFL